MVDKKYKLRAVGMLLWLLGASREHRRLQSSTKKRQIPDTDD